jgi:hypothetical protein
MHPIVRFEKLACQCNQGVIAGMIERLNGGYVFGKLRIVFINVVLQLRTRVTGTGEQYRAGMRQGADHATKELLVHAQMTAARSVGFVVKVATSGVCMNHELVDITRIELEYFGFEMIDPNDGVVMLGHDVLQS